MISMSYQVVLPTALGGQSHSTICIRIVARQSPTLTRMKSGGNGRPYNTTPENKHAFNLTIVEHEGDISDS